MPCKTWFYLWNFKQEEKLSHISVKSLQLYKYSGLESQARESVCELFVALQRHTMKCAWKCENIRENLPSVLAWPDGDDGDRFGPRRSFLCPAIAWREVARHRQDSWDSNDEIENSNSRSFLASHDSLADDIPKFTHTHTTVLRMKEIKFPSQQHHLSSHRKQQAKQKKFSFKAPWASPQASFALKIFKFKWWCLSYNSIAEHKREWDDSCWVLSTSTPLNWHAVFMRIRGGKSFREKKTRKHHITHLEPDSLLQPDSQHTTSVRCASLFFSKVCFLWFHDLIKLLFFFLSLSTLWNCAIAVLRSAKQCEHFFNEKI